MLAVQEGEGEVHVDTQTRRRSTPDEVDTEDLLRGLRFIEGNSRVNGGGEVTGGSCGLAKRRFKVRNFQCSCTIWEERRVGNRGTILTDMGFIMVQSK